MPISKGEEAPSKIVLRHMVATGNLKLLRYLLDSRTRSRVNAAGDLNIRRAMNMWKTSKEKMTETGVEPAIS